MTVERFQFELSGDRLIGNLYLPDETSKHPTVVVGGPMTSVKEQVTGVYAKALADRGIAALCLDHRHYGESDGHPRQYEYYPHKIEDLKAGLQALASHGAIDSERMGIAGVCLGVGYGVWAAVENPLVKAVGGVVGYYRDVPEMRATDPEGFEARVSQGKDAREHYERTGEVKTIPAAALEGDAAMTLQSTYDYYATPRAGVPNYRNEFAVMSREHFLAFDVQSAARTLAAPMLMVHSENGLSPAWARKFYNALETDKRIEWLDGPNQTAFYDQTDLVAQASDHLANHFHQHLR